VQTCVASFAVTDERDRASQPGLGSSGVFKAIADGARAVKRALSEADHSLSPEMSKVGDEIGRCFVANRFADVHAMSAPVLQHANTVDRFVTSWHDAVKQKGPFTSFEVSNAGDIDLAFVPSLEEIPQDQFVGFLEISFANASQEDAFTIGAVLVEDDSGQVRIGALHAR
jgi:hypothetical protein